MIPAYNCSRFLTACIQSVLQQDPGKANMQIMVVDDASKDCDVAALVERVGGGRVEYFRQPENVGSVRNFETALNLSIGHLVHLLHGDDCVKEGFYAAVAKVFEQHPEAGMVFVQNSYINKAGIEVGIKSPMSNEEGILHNWYDRIVVCNLLEVPAAVVKREVHEKLGSYYGAIYGEDWEMWARIAKHYPVGYIPRVLAQYRKSETNISSFSHRHLRSINDIKTIMSLIHRDAPVELRKEIIQKSNLRFAKYFAYISLLQKAHNTKVGFAMARRAFSMHRNSFTFYALAKTAYCYMKNGFSKKKALVPEDDTEPEMI
jgi:glycosyltransferase involved in cell wall biosynthesis